VIICLLLVAWVFVAPLGSGSTLRAAPLADQPTNTGTPLPPTPTTQSTSETPTTGTPQVVPTDTPTPSGPESPTATPKSPPQRGNDPTLTPTVPPGDPLVTKSADPSSGFPGDKIVFTITVRNNAPVPATDVTVDDSIPDVFAIDGASTSQGTVDVSGQRVHAVIGTIEPGGSVTIRISTTIRADAQPGQVDNIAVMTNNTPGDNPGNNTSTTTVTIEGGGPPTPTAGPPPARLPPTGDGAAAANSFWFMLVGAMALLIAAGGLALRLRRTNR
jgi:uncharacterized repeat protein (TIGR01451 family)